MPIHIASLPEGTGCHIRLSGYINALDIKKGLLNIVSLDGWSAPILWDFSAIDGFDLEPPALADIAGFIERTIRNMPQRGRIAVWVTGDHARAAALSYLQFASPEARGQLRVVESRSEADEWLAGEPVEV